MADAVNSLAVRASILTVPDGRVSDLMRLSLQITPSLDPMLQSSGAPEIDLALWPTRIAAELGSMSIHLAPVDATGKVDQTKLVTLGQAGSYRSRGWTGKASAVGAQQLWAATFPGGLEPLWRELEKIVSADPDQQAKVPLLSPTIDSRRLAECLVDSQVSAAQTRITDLSSAKKSNSSVAPDKRAAQTLEAWAIPGAVAGNTTVAQEAANRRQVEVQNAIKAALEGAMGPMPVWAAFTSYAMLEAFANGERLKGPLDGRLAKALSGARPTTEDELLSSRLKSLALTVPPAAADPPPPGTVPVGVGEIERRKLGAMLSHPTVAQYLGMVADIDISQAVWDLATTDADIAERGAVAVTFGISAPDAATNWTAFLNAPSQATGLPAYFGPAERSEAIGNPDANRKLARGLLNLSATRRDGEATTPRFSLSVVDVVNSAKRRIAHARRTFENGSPEVGQELPDLGGRGIALIDSGTQEDEAAMRAAAEALAARADRLHFAEDLLIGYRPIVGMAPRESPSLAVEKSRWRSLVARQVTFDGAVDSAFVSANYNDEREHGHTRSPVGVQRGTDAGGGPVDVMLNHPELFVWTGESLAVPSVAEDQRAGRIEVDASTDLPVGITYALPRAAKDAARGLMPLRDGRRYVFGASAMFVNGCGLSIDATIAALAADPRRALGKGSEAFAFTRCDALPPPIVLLPDDDRLATSSDLSNIPGQTLTTLVIRREDSEATDRRFLFPDQIAFDQAEQQDMFRGERRAKPRGAFGSAAGVGASRNSKTGRFPEAPSRRGPILRIERPADNGSAHEYYPDGYTRGVWAHVGAVHPRGASVPAMAAAAPFRSGPQAIAARPVLLEIRKNESARYESEPRFQLSRDQWHDLPELGLRIPKISIVLAPASMATIDLVADFDPDEILDKHLIARSLANSWIVDGKPIGRAGVRARMAAALLNGRIGELQGATKLIVVHAVRKPLHPPAFEPDFRAIVVSVQSTADAGGKDSLTWPAIVRQHLSDGVDLAHWSTPDGSTCFFVGMLKIDAPSTGVVSCDGEWEDWGPEMVRFNRLNNIWECYRSPQFARLFTVSDFSSNVDEGDLVLHDLAVAPKGLAYTFRDGRARKLKLRLVARSRFAQYYPTGTAVSDSFGKIGPHERTSTETERELERWVPCNFRPAQPNVDRVTPLLETRTSVDRLRQKFTFSRTTGFRVELGDGCYGSGEGEQIALVFNSRQSTAVCDYSTEALRPFSSGVTRWGRDPLRQRKLSQINLVPDDFSGYVERHSRFRLPAAKDADRPDTAEETLLDVLALAYDLQFDSRIGRFYVDIGTQGRKDIFADTFMPFVQLGLCRLQVNAVDGLQLSVPVGEMVQVLPRRSGWIRFRKPRDGFSFDFWMEAPRSVGVDANQQWVLEVTALQKDPAQPDGWRPQMARRGAKNPVQLIKKRQDANGRDFGVWHIDAFRMEKSRFNGQLGVQIEEFEESTLDDGTVLRRLIFGHIVDFGLPR